MKHTIQHEETKVERWTYDEGDIINAMLEKSGIPSVSKDDSSVVSWEVSTDRFGLNSITIKKTSATTDGEKELAE